MSGLYNMSKADFDTTLDMTKIKMMSAEKKQQDSFAN